jgi:hypothetical protein
VLKVRRVQDVPTNKGNAMHDFAARYTPASSNTIDIADLEADF